MAVPKEGRRGGDRAEEREPPSRRAEYCGSMLGFRGTPLTFIGYNTGAKRM